MVSQTPREVLSFQWTKFCSDGRKERNQQQTIPCLYFGQPEGVPAHVHACLALAQLLLSARSIYVFIYRLFVCLFVFVHTSL